MSLRYSIYKVQTLPRLSAQLAYSSTAHFICQELFSSFFKFFRAVFRFVVLANSLHILAYRLDLVKYFFMFFVSFLISIRLSCLTNAFYFSMGFLTNCSTFSRAGSNTHINRVPAARSLLFIRIPLKNTIAINAVLTQIPILGDL